MYVDLRDVYLTPTNGLCCDWFIYLVLCWVWCDKVLRVVVTIIRQIMTEFNGAVLEEAKSCLKSHGAKWSPEFIGVVCYTEPGLTNASYMLKVSL
jgi:hypothetical protein